MAKKATTAIRTRTKRALTQLLEQELAGGDVQIHTGPPGQEKVARQYIGIGTARGAQSPQGMSGDRKVRNDIFSIELWLLSYIPGRDGLEAEEDVEKLMAAVEDILADDPKLTKANGGESIPGLVWAKVGDFEGPETEPVENGSVGWIRADVDCRTYLQ